MPRKKNHQRLRGKGSKGRPSKVPQGPAATEELLAHRQRATGLPREDLMKQRAGVPLEILASRGLITEPQRSAGEQYGALVHRWRRMHQVPDGRRQPEPGGLGGDMDPQKVELVDGAMKSAVAELDHTTPLARAAVESICVDEEMGRMLDSGDVGVRLRSALADGLTALCRVFKTPSRRAA